MRFGTARKRILISRSIVLSNPDTPQMEFENKPDCLRRFDLQCVLAVLLASTTENPYKNSNLVGPEGINSSHNEHTLWIWISANIKKRLFRKLQLIDDATCDQDLRSPPSNHFEKLKGKLEGKHFICVYKQWRLVFTWSDEHGEAQDIYLNNYDYRWDKLWISQNDNPSVSAKWLPRSFSYLWIWLKDS